MRQKIKLAIVTFGLVFAASVGFGLVAQPKANAQAAIGLTHSATSCGLSDVGWMVCPVLRSAAKGADSAFSFIYTSLLQVEVGLMNGKGGSEVSEKVWSAMRNVANVMFVVLFLVVIYSIVSGRGIGNYNLKKIIPRAIVVIFLANLSLVICQALIDASNILGSSILGFVGNMLDSAGVQAPLKMGAEISASVGKMADDSTLSTLTASILSSATLSWVLLVPLSIIVISITLICAAMIIILICRKVLVVVAVLLSPVAFMLYLLPNTEKMFASWRKMLMGALILYPIVSILLASGQIVGSAIAATDGNLNSGGYSVEGDVGADGVKSQTTMLIASAATVLPLIATWPLFKLSLSGIETASVRMRRGGADKSYASSSQKRRENSPSPNSTSRIMNNIQKAQQALQDSDSVGRRSRKSMASLEQKQFNDAVESRLDEIRAETDGPSAQERYETALKDFEASEGSASALGSSRSGRSGSFSARNSKAVELKAAEAYLLESMKDGRVISSPDGTVSRVSSAQSLERSKAIAALSGGSEPGGFNSNGLVAGVQTSLQAGASDTETEAAINNAVNSGGGGSGSENKNVTNKNAFNDNALYKALTGNMSSNNSSGQRRAPSGPNFVDPGAGGPSIGANSTVDSNIPAESGGNSAGGSSSNGNLSNTGASKFNFSGGSIDGIKSALGAGSSGGNTLSNSITNSSGNFVNNSSENSSSNNFNNSNTNSLNNTYNNSKTTASDNKMSSNFQGASNGSGQNNSNDANGGTGLTSDRRNKTGVETVTLVGSDIRRPKQRREKMRELSERMTNPSPLQMKAQSTAAHFVDESLKVAEKDIDEVFRELATKNESNKKDKHKGHRR